MLGAECFKLGWRDVAEGLDLSAFESGSVASVLAVVTVKAELVAEIQRGGFEASIPASLERLVGLAAEHVVLREPFGIRA